MVFAMFGLWGLAIKEFESSRFVINYGGGSGRGIVLEQKPGVPGLMAIQVEENTEDF